MNKLLIACFLLVCATGFSQYGTLLVSDLDDPSMTLEGVSVYDGTRLLGKTDHVGAFRFERRFKGKITLSHPDYETKTLKVKTGKDWTQDVLLSVVPEIYNARKARDSTVLYARCLPDSIPAIAVGAAENPATNDAFAQYMARRNYPPRALGNGIEGTVVLTFLVDTNGDVACVEVTKSVSFELDKEAVRMVSATSGWIPARRNGVPVASVYTVEVPFRLAEADDR